MKHIWDKLKWTFESNHCIGKCKHQDVTLKLSFDRNETKKFQFSTSFEAKDGLTGSNYHKRIEVITEDTQMIEKVWRHTVIPAFKTKINEALMTFMINRRK